MNILNVRKLFLIINNQFYFMINKKREKEST